MTARPFRGDCFISLTSCGPVESNALNTADHTILRIEWVNYIHALIRTARFAGAALKSDVESTPRCAQSSCIEPDINSGGAAEQALSPNQALFLCSYWYRRIFRGGGPDYILRFTVGFLEVRLISLRASRRTRMYRVMGNFPIVRLSGLPQGVKILQSLPGVGS